MPAELTAVSFYPAIKPDRFVQRRLTATLKVLQSTA
jgi:hypothetical protein